MKDPLISVIVPIYQVERYLNKCVDSICNQTYRNLEILLVDDGSRDGSGIICDEYAKIDQRVVVIHQENKGLSTARNKGIEISSGDYLTFVDPDDYLLHDKYIELLLGAMVKDNAQISMCGQITFRNNAQPNYEIDYEKNRVVSGRDILNQRPGVYGDCYWNVLSKLFEKDIFADVRFPEGHILEDTAILHRLLLPATTVSLLGIRMYGKRVRSDSILGTVDPNKMFRESMFAFNDRISYYREMDDEELVKRALFEKAASKAIYYLRCEEKDALDTLAEISLEDRPSLQDLNYLFEYYFPGQKKGVSSQDKKTIVLHIGQTKTGTTAIQAFMRKNRKRIEKQGICFYNPVEYVIDSFRNASFVVPSALNENDYVPDDLSDSQLRLEKWLFGEYAKPYNTLIMSDETEWIAGYNYGYIWSSIRRYYESIFGKDLDFKIIISLRRQDDWVYSIWKERVSSLSSWESRDFRTYLEYVKRAGYLDYKHGLELLKETFGKDSICVIPYTYRREENSIIDDFCSFAGIRIDEDFILPKSRINASITGEVALAMYVLNCRELVCNVDRKKIEWAAEMLSGFYPETERWYPLPREERQQLIEIYKDDNQAIAEEYLHQDKLFDNEIGDYRELIIDHDRDRKYARKIIEFADLLPAMDGFQKNDC